MHAYASDDPIFLAMNRRAQRETNGALGPFCVRCHAPMAVQEGLTKDGLNLGELPQAKKGVTCFFCHAAESMDGTHNNPLMLATDGRLFGPFGDPASGIPHRGLYSPMMDETRAESAAACGSCHDIVNQHGAAVERTFQEWQQTLFAKPPLGLTCASGCHMTGRASTGFSLRPPAKVEFRFSPKFWRKKPPTMRSVPNAATTGKLTTDGIAPAASISAVTSTSVAAHRKKRRQRRPPPPPAASSPAPDATRPVYKDRRCTEPLIPPTSTDHSTPCPTHAHPSPRRASPNAACPNITHFITLSENRGNCSINDNAFPGPHHNVRTGRTAACKVARAAPPPHTPAADSRGSSVK